MFTAPQPLCRTDVFDGTEQKNCIPAETNRVFFKEFVRQIRIRYRREYIRFPELREK